MSRSLGIRGKNTLGVHVCVVTNTNQYWNLLYLGMMHKQIESSFACCTEYFFSCPPPLSCRFHMKSWCIIGFLLTLAAHSHWSHWISFDKKKNWYLRSAIWAIYQWFSVCISVSMTSGNTCSSRILLPKENEHCYNMLQQRVLFSQKTMKHVASDSCICRKTFSHWHAIA